MKRITVLFLLTFLVVFPVISQKYQVDSVAIANIIHNVFDGMRESDTSKMAPHMHFNVKMQSLTIDDKGNKISELNGASAWIDAVANNSGEIWNEEIENLRIQSDGAVATAWMDYRFYLGEELSHCGVNSFQFIKIDGKWKIIYIIDSRNKRKCN